MNMEQFINIIVEKVKEKMALGEFEHGEVVVTNTVKANDNVVHGISIRNTEEGAFPIIYLEEYYKDYNDGVTVDEIVENIANIYHHSSSLNPDCILSMEYAAIKDKLAVLLMDRDKNEKYLQKVIYKPVGNGFVIVPYFIVTENEKGLSKITITKDMAEVYNYDIDTLIDTAFANTIEKYTPVFGDLLAFVFNSEAKYSKKVNPMRKDFEMPKQDLPMCLLSNTNTMNGAIALFYPGIIERIGEILDSSYYILPSSLHEVIIVPQNINHSDADMKRLVYEVNRETVPLEDMLSDKVLFYNKEEGSINLV